MVQILVVVFLGFSSVASAMDFAADKELSTWPLEALKYKLAGQLNFYELYLPKSLGCNCCKSIKEVFNTDQNKHVVQRLNQLNVIKQMMNAPMFMPEEILLYIETTMEPFSGDFGKSFAHNCKDEIRKFLKANSLEMLESHHSCVCCKEENATVVYKDCGHKTYCETCINQINSANMKGRCPICSTVSELLNLLLKNTRNLCINCGMNKSEIYFQPCGHLVFCSKCSEQLKSIQCPMCIRRIEKSHKIISVSPRY